MLLAALIAELLLQQAAAQPAASQEGLLDFDSGRADTALAVEQALRAGDPWEQLSWTFTLRPSVLYRQYLDERGGDVFNPRLSATLQLRFGEKPVDSVRRAMKLERALLAHARAGRLEVRDALLAHAELLLAQDARQQAELELHTLDAAATALERQEAELALDSAEADLRAAQAAAAEFGLTGPARFEQLRFGLPVEPRISELPAYRLQQLEVAEAEARYLAAGTASVLRDFRLGAAVRNEAVDFDLEVGLLAGRPGLRLGTIHPGGRARMEVRVSAEIAIGDGLADLPHLAAETERAQLELERLSLELRADWLLALESQQLSEAELDLASAQLQEAEAARQELLVAQAEMAGGADEKEAERMTAALARADREVQRLQTRVYRAWITYVRRHFEVLEASEADWYWQHD